MRRVKEFLGLAGAVIGMAWVCVRLFAWATWQTVKVAFLRFFLMDARADRIEAEADRAFRQLCGVPEPGEGWD